MAGEADKIIITRRLILQTLHVGEAIAQRGDAIYRTVMALRGGQYERGYFGRDIRWLEEKGYVRVCELMSGQRGHDQISIMELWWELTADGMSIAQDIREDPDLEV